MRNRTIFLGLLLGLGLTFAGCGGDDKPRHHKDGDDETMGPAAPPTPVMSGQETFFDGKLLAEATLGRGFHRSASSASDDSGGSPKAGGGGGGHHHHGGGSGGGGGDAGYLGGGSGGTGGDSARPLRESSMPPVTLGIHLTNRTDGPLTVVFDGCDSALGNFVVTPEQTIIPAGGSFDVDPMRSLLGELADEIPLSLSLRVGGKTEKKVITLRLASPLAAPFREEAPPPGAAPAPAPVGVPAKPAP